jgi:hypothetical protein
MKFLLFVYGSLASTSFAKAQYFSHGWKPGQPVTSSAPTAPEYTPAPSVAATPPGGSFFQNFLASEPVVAFFEKLGINITERLGAYREQPKYWDERIPLITDDNYKETIVEESLTQEEEKARVWFLVMYGIHVRSFSLSLSDPLAQRLPPSKIQSRNSWTRRSTPHITSPKLKLICRMSDGVALITSMSPRLPQDGVFGGKCLVCSGQL